jgi:hypothetical protein
MGWGVEGPAVVLRALYQGTALAVPIKYPPVFKINPRGEAAPHSIYTNISVPHPFAFFANGWDTTTLNRFVILSVAEGPAVVLRALYQDTTIQLAEQFIWSFDKRQGMTGRSGF